MKELIGKRVSVKNEDENEMYGTVKAIEGNFILLTDYEFKRFAALGEPEKRKDFLVNLSNPRYFGLTILD